MNPPLPALSPEDRLHVALAVIRELQTIGRPERGLLVAEDRIRQALYALQQRDETIS